MMKKPSDFFHGEKNYNCAQSVLACFQDEFQLSDEKIQSLQSFGGGRAPEGRCGALHAALELVEDPIRKEALIRDFINEAGGSRLQNLENGASLSVCSMCRYGYGTGKKIYGRISYPDGDRRSCQPACPESTCEYRDENSVHPGCPEFACGRQFHRLLGKYRIGRKAERWKWNGWSWNLDVSGMS